MFSQVLWVWDVPSIHLIRVSIALGVAVYPGISKTS